MPMPNNLLFVRHGESEGNVAVHKSKNGDDSAFTEDFRARHSSKWRLSDRGINQAEEAGLWLRENFPEPFDRFYTSEYLRAMETAALLNLPEAMWYPSFHLRERNWGDLDSMTVAERKEKHSEAMSRRLADPFYWDPPNGKSIADLCLWIDRILDTLHRECAGKNVIIVCHGEVMWAFRVQLERMTQERFLELDQSKNPHDRIHNCQVIQYTRLDPDGSDMNPAPYFGWMRSVCPWDQTLSSNHWVQIERAKFTNEDLMKRVCQVPRIIN